MDYQEIQKKISALQSSGLYNGKQLEILKYAFFRFSNQDISFLVDYRIPASYMEIYVKLFSEKVNVEKYITEGWHQYGYEPKALYFLIFYHSKGIDIQGIDKTTSVEEVKEILNARTDLKHLNSLYEKSSVEKEELELLKSINFNKQVECFFLRQGEKNDISMFLDPKFRAFSLEQIKYLFSIASTGQSIENIANPSLNVEEMRNIMLKSRESLEFLNEIQDDIEQRKSGR